MSLHTYDEEEMVKFVMWLDDNGYPRLPVTNEWECVRFQAGDETRIIYRNKHGALTLARRSFVQWEAFHRRERLPNVKKSATVAEEPAKTISKALYADPVKQAAMEISAAVCGTNTDDRWRLYELVADMLVNRCQNFQASHFRALAKAEKG